MQVLRRVLGSPQAVLSLSRDSRYPWVITGLEEDDHFPRPLLRFGLCRVRPGSEPTSMQRKDLNPQPWRHYALDRLWPRAP